MNSLLSEGLNDLKIILQDKLWNFSLTNELG